MAVSDEIDCSRQAGWGMMIAMIRRGLVILLAMASLTWAAQQPSQDPKPPAQAAPNAKADSPPGPELDIQQMVKETEQFDMRPHKMAIFWWIPPDYWDAALRQQGYNSERVRNVFKPFRDYNVFMIAVGNMESSGMNWAKEPEVKKNVLLRDQRGTSYKPLADVPLEISGIIDLMRPVFKNMMGNFGEGLQFIVFPVRDDAGNIFADAHKSS